MAKDNNWYIQFYTAGSAAVKVEVQDEQMWAPLPKPKHDPRIAIHVDPAAMIGFVVAVCMLILLAVGITQLNTSRREVATLERYVSQLQAENHALAETYSAGYDLEDIRMQALDMGMVPAEEASSEHIYVTMTQTAVTVEPTLWERTTAFLTSLFA